MRFRPHALTLFSIAGLVAGTGFQAAMASDASAPASNGSASAPTPGGTSNANLSTAKKMRVKLDAGDPMEFSILHPGWRESKMVRVVDPNRPNMNIEKTIYARLVVAADSEAAMQRAVDTVGGMLRTNRPGSHTFTPYAGRTDVFVLEANSVEDAVNLADMITDQPGIEWAEVDHRDQIESKSYAPRGGLIPTDPSVVNQWHVVNTTGAFAGHDHNIDGAWSRGYSGSGVVVGVLEAFANSFYHVDNLGVTHIHPDLVNKLNEDLSLPTDPFNVSYSHGVSVAGLIGAQGNNGIAAAGVAYNAMLASLRNGGQIAAGESFSHRLRDIDIINNSWGPVNESYPVNSVGTYLIAFPDDFEIDIPQITHSGLSRTVSIGLDQSIRLGRGRKGRLLVFSAGNGSHFQGFARLATGNAISLPGIGPNPSVDPYGYLDITALDPSQTDGDNDGIPDVFLMDGTSGTAFPNPFGPSPVGFPWRWSGHFGDRVEYNQLASTTRTFAIASVGMSNARSGYSTTGCSVFASAYSQDTTLAPSFTPDPGGGWGPALIGPGLVTLEQTGDGDQDSIDCNTDPVINLANPFADPDAETCMFNGTSAAAPVAAGIMALMLEAKPSLTIRDVQHIIVQTAIPLNYDPTTSYWPSVILGLGATDPDDGNPPSPDFWTTNSGGIRHSDEYGFGLIDADAAVAAAATWQGVDPLVVLDSGTVEIGGDANPFIEDGEIPDAEFVAAQVLSDTLETNFLQPGERQIFPLTCNRENLLIEGVELTLNIDGVGAGDLLIALRSPQGTISPLALPRGDSNGLSDTAYADYTFSTYKHWGELAGGQWDLIIQDFRPDDASPEGTPPDLPDDLGVEQVTFLGTFGLPGAPDHTDKELVSYRLKIFGTDTGVDPFNGCALQLTSCPGDVDGNGIVDIFDFQIFLVWYNNLDILADINGDGTVNHLDINAFIGLWVPGFCGNTGMIGNRPPTGVGSGPNDPIVRPL